MSVRVFVFHKLYGIFLLDFSHFFLLFAFTFCAVDTASLHQPHSPQYKKHTNALLLYVAICVCLQAYYRQTVRLLCTHCCMYTHTCRQSSSYVKYYLRFIHCPVAVISLFILCAVAAVACNTHTHTPLCTFARPLLLCILHFTFFFVLTFGFIRICVRSLVCWFFLAVCCFYCYCQLLADCCHFNCYLTLIVKHTLESLLLLLLLFVVFSRTTAIVRPRSTVCLPFIYMPSRPVEVGRAHCI